MMRAFVLFAVLVCFVEAGCPFSGNKAGDCPFGAGAPRPTKTGCVCKTKCGASIEQGNFNCDWCYTENNCGNRGFKGRWDFCDYSANTTYESEPWNYKLDSLWAHVDANHGNAPYPNVLKIITESVQTTFQSVSDVMPEGRVKFIHSQGATCKISMKMSPYSPFTGLFAAGTTAHGLLRMGSALAVDKNSGVIPGIGVKFLRTGRPSGNFVGLNTLNPLPDNKYNFWELPLSNHLPAPDTASTKIIAKKFAQASGCPTKVGLSDICKYGTDGKMAPKPVFPFSVSLESPTVTMPNTPVDQETLQKYLASVEAGTVIYKVTAYVNSTFSFHLGDMVTESPCVNSVFGDSALFFRHQLIEEDWALRPDFMAAVNPQADCGVSKISPIPPQPQCENADAGKFVV